MSPSEATEAYGYCSVCGHLNNDLSVCNCAGKTLQKVKWQQPTYSGRPLTCPTCGLTYRSDSVHTCTGIKGVSINEVLTKAKKLSIDDIVVRIDGIPDETPNIRSYNVGSSNYAKHKIQPWDIWLEYNLNPWDADIIKRTLRTKEGDSRILDYEKIIHICQERIRQLTLKESTSKQT